MRALRPSPLHLRKCRHQIIGTSTFSLEVYTQGSSCGLQAQLDRPGRTSGERGAREKHFGRVIPYSSKSLLSGNSSFCVASPVTFLRRVWRVARDETDAITGSGG